MQHKGIAKHNSDFRHMCDTGHVLRKDLRCGMDLYPYHIVDLTMLISYVYIMVDMDEYDPGRYGQPCDFRFTVVRVA